MCLPSLLNLGITVIASLGHFVPPVGDGGRGTEVCIPAAALRKRTGVLLPSAHKSPARFPASVSGVQTASHPVSTVSRASRYNTLHLASKVVCQRGHKPPLETPGFVSAWPQIAFLHLCPHLIQNLKKRRRSAYEWWAGLRHFFIRPVGRNETRCIWRIVFPG